MAQSSHASVGPVACLRQIPLNPRKRSLQRYLLRRYSPTQPVSCGTCPCIRSHRIATFILLLLLVVDCGPTFTCNHLDRQIPWYVDSYVDLTRDQRTILRGQLKPLLRWHREEELVRHVEILDAIEGDALPDLVAAAGFPGHWK